MIQRGHILEYKSVKLFADFALLHMLQHSTSAEVVHEKWVKDEVYVDEIQSF
ncbi:hypothetical protein Plhal304r1_c017g0061171 [Plasmopara halstedii]